jgi:hypothetical protein
LHSRLALDTNRGANADETLTLGLFKEGGVPRDLRLKGAHASLEVSPNESIAILALLVDDEDAEVRTIAEATLGLMSTESVDNFLADAEVAEAVKTAVLSRRRRPAIAPVPVNEGQVRDDQQDAEFEASVQADDDGDLGDPELEDDAPVDRESIMQKIARMTFPQRLKAASKGSREVRAILIRDPSKLIAMAVLNSPKVTDAEIESFARMGNVAVDVLRAIGANRAWIKNYPVVVALTRNSKTPLGLSLNLMSRLNDRDLTMLSVDRNVPDSLRVAAKRRVMASASR